MAVSAAGTAPGFTPTVAVQGVIDPEVGGLAQRMVYLARGLAGRIQGVEVGFFAHTIEDVEEAWADPTARRAMGSLPANSLHVAQRAEIPLDQPTVRRVMALAGSLHRAGLIRCVSFHLDLLDWFDLFQSLGQGLDLRLENLGSDAAVGNTIDEVAAALRRFPAWGLVLDLAHAMEMQGKDGAGPRGYLARVGDRVRQLHYSWPGNLYGELAPEIKTSHSLTCLDAGLTAGLPRLAAAAPCAMITLEGVVPPGALGLELLASEMDMLEYARQNHSRGEGCARLLR